MRSRQNGGAVDRGAQEDGEQHFGARRAQVPVHGRDVFWPKAKSFARPHARNTHQEQDDGHRAHAQHHEPPRESERDGQSIGGLWLTGCALAIAAMRALLLGMARLKGGSSRSNAASVSSARPLFGRRAKSRKAMP